MPAEEGAVACWHFSDMARCLTLSPLSGAKRKLDVGALRAAFDPSETSASISCCGSEAGFSLYQFTRLSRYNGAY
jgi:hypothetical protein